MIYQKIKYMLCPLLALNSACGTYLPEIRESWDVNRSQEISANGILEANVKEKIYCAIYLAVKAQRVFPEGWAVQSTLDLQVDHIGSVNPGLSYIVPFNAAENFTLGLGATLSSQATREDKIGSYWDLDRLRKYKTDECDDAGEIKGSSPLITSDLGLTQWLTDALASVKYFPSSPISQGNVFNQDSLTYHAKFIIITTGSLNPTWKLIRFNSGNGAALASVNRTRTHDILLTFGPKFKPNSPNIALSQHFSTEYAISLGNSGRQSAFPASPPLFGQ
ncbi:hypothetical protein FF100_29270 [Methylobacterium terricola]|uniref:Uncharacterized protein n=1 Tax=Methylobacterium terricola TaxID=2583531 RepID=A0A5C4L8D2_9HYPH|nr:hypothetical protein [Methylobacterium terricola]TNC08433.1 hypothetical protein FF100_29270 [Methylobacterium terricola]